MGDRSPVRMYQTFGAYVRSQRQLAQLTLRQLAKLARISNPYLSQIEHGLALPSIAVISALADALSVSAETLLLQAAGISSSAAKDLPSHTEEAIRQDGRLDNSQKHALLSVLASFVSSVGERHQGAAGAAPVSPPLVEPLVITDDEKYGLADDEEYGHAHPVL